MEDLARHWTLDPRITYLNHGSFGACPLPVLAAQEALRRRMEAGPVDFMMRHLEDLLGRARAALGRFVGANGDDIALVDNATTGVNTVLRSLRFAPGDELLTTNHDYNACQNALRFVAARAGAVVRVAEVPFPIAAPEQVTEAICAAVTERTRLLLVSHVTSPTGLVFPIARIIAEMTARGIDTLVDGAHAPGMLPLRIDDLGAAYYTGNCHKWMCTPKGAAFLHVREDRQPLIRPLVISHGANATRTDISPFRRELDWTGTRDYTPWLCIPAAIDFLGSLLPGGWPALQERNHRLALAWQERLCAALHTRPHAPADMIGALVTLPLPDGAAAAPAALDPLQERLFHAHHIEVPVFPWPAPPRRMLRVSAQIYNRSDDIDILTSVLGHLGISWRR